MNPPILPNELVVPIEKLKALDALHGVVDYYLSNNSVYSLRHHMCRHTPFIFSLLTPKSICGNEVETISCTIFHVVLKANKGVNDSALKHHLERKISWKLEQLGTFRSVANDV